MWFVTAFVAHSNQKAAVIKAQEWRIAKTSDPQKNLIGLVFLEDLLASRKYGKLTLQPYRHHQTQSATQFSVVRYVGKSHQNNEVTYHRMYQFGELTHYYKDYPCQIGSPLILPNNILVGILADQDSHVLLYDLATYEEIMNLSKDTYTRVGGQDI